MPKQQLAMIVPSRTRKMWAKTYQLRLAAFHHAVSPRHPPQSTLEELSPLYPMIRALPKSILVAKVPSLPPKPTSNGSPLNSSSGSKLILDDPRDSLSTPNSKVSQYHLRQDCSADA